MHLKMRRLFSRVGQTKTSSGGSRPTASLPTPTEVIAQAGTLCAGKSLVFIQDTSGTPAGHSEVPEAGPGSLPLWLPFSWPPHCFTPDRDLPGALVPFKPLWITYLAPGTTPHVSQAFLHFISIPLCGRHVWHKGGRQATSARDRVNEKKRNENRKYFKKHFLKYTRHTQRHKRPGTEFTAQPYFHLGRARGVVVGASFPFPRVTAMRH